LDKIFREKDGLNLWIMLEAVQDPSNIGAIMRVAKAAGAAGLLLAAGCADPYSPRSLRASMGAAFGVPMVQGVSAEDVLRAAKKRKIRIAATCVDEGQPHWDIDWRPSTLVMFGSEARGLSHAATSEADIRVSIPMDPAMESLNVAVSCGVIVYEALRQIRR
jgi:TrmH family RNA methyltransferase